MGEHHRYAAAHRIGEGMILCQPGVHLLDVDLQLAVVEGSMLRLRPLVMTLTLVVVGLLPIMFSHGTGADMMRRIAAPVVGGMFSAALLALLVIPALYALWQRRRWKLV